MPQCKQVEGQEWPELQMRTFVFSCKLFEQPVSDSTASAQRSVTKVQK